MKKWTSWIIYLLVFALMAGCADAGSYIKDNYPLVSVDGKGKNTAKVYVAEGKDVPTTAKEIAAEDKPQEISKESADQMFLVYQDKIINIRKDPNNESDSLVEVDTVEYAKEHYDSSFLQGYITATLLQSLFGGGWFNSRGSSDYRGYTPPPTYTQRPQTPPAASKQGTTPPTTSDRKGSFGGGTAGGGTSTTPSGSVRRNDGSTPTYKKPTTGSSKPSTGSRSGSFTKRK
ncbi:DUF4247 domain-containing protein [Paenibacillus hamazuiensis]|uniref:DUF4247 domain-containing protein n=1 Tax=Paenibacillus hamazuiensis TaxID=2936508 RepID=UPI00200C70A9|nr:DUF4247 domain-containing protein [Paenibacillus hamazuiensis]